MDIVQVTIKGDAKAIAAAQKALTLAMEVVQQEHQLTYEWVDCGFLDGVGGHHDSGCGWAPDGTYCGECSQSSCRNCGIWEYKRKSQQLKKGEVYVDEK